MYPPLELEHQVYGLDYCSGYVDKGGKWNTGFYCPPLSPETGSIFCCGTSVHKYCCTGQSSSNSNPNPSMVPIQVELEEGEIDISKDYDLEMSSPTSTITTSSTIVIPTEERIDMDIITRNSYVAAVICGLVAVTVLMTIVACFYCKCCLLYKKRRSQLPGGGLYRIPPSSTTCGLINSGSRSNITPGNVNGSITPGSSHFSHSGHNSAFVPISILDPWANNNNLPLNHHTPLNLRTLLQPPPQIIQQQGQLLNGLLNSCSGTARPPRFSTHHQGPTPNNVHLVFAHSPENSSNSSISTISSCNTTRPQTLPQQSNYIPRTNSIPQPNINAATTIALRLQRQLLQAQQHQSRITNNFTRNTNTIPNSGNIAPTIYSNNSLGRPPPNPHLGSTMSSLINSVSFSTNSNNSSLPPPYFLEQYRIRNRVRAPRNPPLPPQTLTLLPPSYNEIQREQPRERRGRTETQSQQPPSLRQTSRRPKSLISPSSSTPLSSPTAASNPLNDLSAPSPPRRRPRRKGTQGSGDRNNSTSPSRDISRQITQPSNLFSQEEEEYDTGGDTTEKILNTQVRVQRSTSDMQGGEAVATAHNIHTQDNFRRPRKSQSLENININVSPPIVLKSDANASLQFGAEGEAN